jgi:hypothetical protein
MRLEHLEMGLERPGPKICRFEIYRPVLSSESLPQFRVKNISDHERERKNLVSDPKGRPNTKIDSLTDRPL